MRASQVDQYLNLPKTLAARPVWMEGTKRGQVRLQWTVLCEGIGSTHIEIVASLSAPRPKFSMSLMVPPPIARLDIDPTGLHVNKRTSPRLVQGNNYHPWALNRPDHSETLPKKLGEAIPYLGPDDLQGAFEWLCHEINVEAKALPQLPRKDTLV